MKVKNDLPAELKQLCCDFVPEVQIKRVSKKFREGFDVFESLEKHYRANQTLKPIIDRLRADIFFSHSEFVKKVYKRVIDDAYAFPGSAVELRRTRKSHASRVSSLRLQEVVEWTKAQNIIAIFERVAEQLRSAQRFLNALNGRQNLTAFQRADQIRVWMDQNRAALSTLINLDLSDLHLTYLPPEIGHFQGLRMLFLHKNKLTVLPAELGNLNNLRMLYLDRNQLIKVPTELGGLRQLEVLNLNRNQLTEVPSELGNLTALLELCLSNNQISELPAELRNLTAVESLSLTNNRLFRIPEALEGLTELQVLYLSNNRIAEVPAWLANLNGLSFLHLDHNELTRVPAELGNLRQLREFWLNNNQLRERVAGFEDRPRVLRLDDNPVLRTAAQPLGKGTKRHIDE